MSFPLKASALAAILLLVSGPSSAQNRTLRTAMRVKLANAQQLLEAVVIADFAAIDRSAEVLSRISDTEMASWQVGASPEYRKQAMSFVLSVRGVREAAAKRNIDAALAEYTALVSSCTRCHAHARRPLVVSFEPPPFR